jgi:hypothetical protein
VKKILLIVILLSIAFGFACSRQKALDRIMADPQMKAYILSEAMKTEITKAQLADSIFADKNITNKYISQLIANEYSRNDLLNRMLKADSNGVWIIGKLAENPILREKMRGLPK